MRPLCAGGPALVAVILSAAMSPRRAAAQSSETAAAHSTFEVASIKLSDPATSNSVPLDPGGGFRAENITVKDLIGFAYDLVAKSEESLNEDPQLSHSERQAFNDLRRYRMRSLLEDRFHLQFHIRTKEMPVYVLVVDKNGLKLPLAKESDGSMGQLMMGSGQLIAHGIPLSQFADNLRNFVDRDVIDKTGLTELYDIKLECTSERAQMSSDDTSVSAGAPPVSGPAAARAATRTGEGAG
jgi:uncharacterized protein (TIGR03435 family)